jgi:transcriptional regulator with XRE-family HTH domain
MITPTQMRAARAMLDVPQGHVAEHLGIAANTLSKIESGQSDVSMSRMSEIQRFYEREGIAFTENDGVKWSREEIRVYEGTDQFIDFIDDIYEVAKTKGGEFCLFNAKPENWISLMGEEKYKSHSKRMEEIGDKVKVKITSKKGNANFISKAFAEYRWVPEEMFNAKSFYAYGDNIAFMNFDSDNIEKSRILVLKHPEFANGFKILFNIAWENVAEIPIM